MTNLFVESVVSQYFQYSLLWGVMQTSGVIWCGPCQQFSPIFEQVAGEMSTQACFVKLDTEQNQNTAGSYNIRSIPTLMIFHHGKEVARLSGALPKAQFEQWLAKNLPSV